MESNGIDHSFRSQASKCCEQVRVWVDGCFDLPHYGHAIFLRRAKSLGDYLVVGVHVDSDVINDKGIVFTPHADRVKMVKSIKWVDEIVEKPPRKTSLQTLDSYGCEFCVHGDDPVIDKYGIDSYAYAKNVARYRETRRTPGVSTTDLIDRILWVTDQLELDEIGCPDAAQDSKESIQKKPWAARLEDSSILKVLMDEEALLTIHCEPKESDKIIYTSGSFDLFHVGHVDFLEKCKQQGDYLIVGIHGDDDIRRYVGKYFPITTLRERVLSVSSCRYVDKVIIGAPHIVTARIIDEYKIDHVIHGSTPISLSRDGQDPYADPKARGIFSVLDSGNQFTLKSIMNRILLDRSYFKERNIRKRQKVQENLMDINSNRK